MKKILRLLSYVLVAALASAITLFAAPAAAQPQSQTKLDQLGDLIEERFIGEADRAAMDDAAAAAMVDSLGDEWSYYIPASQYQEHLDQVNNSYVGVGITILTREEGDGFLVTKVNVGGPAEEAGMLAGDIIVAVEGISTAGMDTTEVSAIVKGEENTPVVITVSRHGRRRSSILRLSFRSS